MARWWNGRHAVVRRPCPPRREGSSPSLVTALYALSCGPKRRPSEDWSASSTLAWGTVGCLADFERWVYEARLAGSTPARPTGSARCPPEPSDPDIERLQPGERRPAVTPGRGAC